MENEIVNKVAESSLVQIDLDDFTPKDEIAVYDLKQNLYEGLILREKDFRQFLKAADWKDYKGKILAITCSADAIIPNWAYMLLASTLQKKGVRYYFGTREAVAQKLMQEKLSALDYSIYDGKRVLIKGCGSMEASPEIYLEVTARLQPIVQSLMFGEACSTVPVYKRNLND